MFRARLPSPLEIDRFTARSQSLALSYAPIGLAQTVPSGYDLSEVVATIGHGEADFARAKDALSAWAQFDLPWIEVFPRTAPIAAGTVVAVLAHHAGFWSLNACRIVYCIGDVDRGRHFGFAYGTLADHAESGEEIFELSHQDSGDVRYRIRAASRPRALLARLGFPIARAMQARFRRESVDAMTRALRADR